MPQDHSQFKVELNDLPHEQRATWLYHIVRGFGFNRKQCEELSEPLRSGKMIANKAWEAIIDQSIVTIRPRRQGDVSD